MRSLVLVISIALATPARAGGLSDVHEIDDDGMRAGADECLGGQRIFGGTAAEPGAAVDKDIDGRPLPSPVSRTRMGGSNDRIDVEAFISARPISYSLRRAERFSRALARGGNSSQHLIAVRRIDRLIVGTIERVLVHVAPDKRAFDSFPRGGGLHVL